mmetsp:Transcript_30883/g.91768  ORF Transcript_30883/g.91768 Transcript_30883/m.91768 type:complete len:300 (+) Transcript_30883:70-969(+)
MANFQVKLGSDWADFGQEANRLLEEAILAGEPGLQLHDRGQTYLVDFRSMVQRNSATGREREIRVTFQDESRARQVAEVRGRLAAEEDEAAAAAAEREQRDREAAEAIAAAEQAAAVAERERREREEAEAAVAAERERRDREEAEAEAEARAEEEKRRQAEEEARVTAMRGDKLTLGVQLDEEATALWGQGRLQEAGQKLAAATAILRWVHRWDPRAKMPRVQALLVQRLESLERRSQQLAEEQKLPPLVQEAAPLPQPAAPPSAAEVEAPATSSVTASPSAAATAAAGGAEPACPAAA